MTNWTLFYTDYGNDLQETLLRTLPQGESAGWDKHLAAASDPPPRRKVERHEHEWPIARTQWTRLYLDPAKMALARDPVRTETTATYEALGDGLMFLTPPLEHATEITGPSAAKLFVSSSTGDADLFLVIQVFDPDGKEVVFHGALDPHTPIAQGWLRASHRKLDPHLSRPYRPYHTHDELWPLAPGEVVELDVEIWPTCIVIPAGYRISLSVRGKDYVHKGASGGRLSNMKNEFTGCGPFLHDDPHDRPAAIFGGRTTIHFGAERLNVLLPIVPTGR